MPATVLVPKIEQSHSSNSYTSDSIGADQGIVVKEERQQQYGGVGASFTDNVGGNFGPQVFNEVRPVHQSDIPGYEKNTLEEMQLAALGLPTNFNQGW